MTNHVRFDEGYFPYRKQTVTDAHVKERLENQLQEDSPVTWELYHNSLLRNACEKVHYDLVFDDFAVKVVEKPETFVQVNQYQYLPDILHQQQASV